MVREKRPTDWSPNYLERRPAVQKWLLKEAAVLPEPEIYGHLREIEFEEKW